MKQTLPTITAVIHTKNSAKTLERTLKSVTFADEILVVDMQSTDKTLEIAEQYHARILSVPDFGFVEPARNVALEALKTDWALLVDADEVIPTKLSLYIPELMTKGAIAFAIPRKNLIFGSWVQHSGWWPDYVIRLFAVGSVIWPDPPLIHAQPIVTGSLEKVPAREENAIEHHNYESVAEYVDRLQRYTTIQATQTSLTQANLEITQLHLWQTMTDEFARRYFAEEGHKDGVVGSMLAWFQAFSELILGSKRWENSGRVESTDSQLAGLNYHLSVLSYWRATYQIKHTRGIQQLYWRIRRKLYL